MRNRYFISTLILFVLALQVIAAQNVVQNVAQKKEGSLSPHAKMFLMQYANSQKKSSVSNYLNFEQLKENYSLTLSSGETKSSQWALPVFVSFASNAVMESILPLAETKFGFRTTSKLKTICTGSLPVNKIEEMAALEGILQIDCAGYKAFSCVDSSRLKSKVDELSSLEFLQINNNGIIDTLQGLTGKGVIVGVIDEGIDFTHPNFCKRDDISTTRIKRVWDQKSMEGPNVPDMFSFGREFTTPKDISSAACSKNSNSTHGTHTVGIAAGSGAGGRYMGMAPEADLILVSTDMTIDHVLNGLQYISKYASDYGQPAVVNMSIGSHLGPHDGTSSFDRSLAELKRDSFAIVGSVGNDGVAKRHVSYTFTEDKAVCIPLKFSDGTNTSYFYITDTKGKSLNYKFILGKRNGVNFIGIDSSELITNGSFNGSLYTKDIYKEKDRAPVNINLTYAPNSFNNTSEYMLYISAPNLNKSYDVIVKISSENTTMNAWAISAAFDSDDEGLYMFFPSSYGSELLKGDGVSSLTEIGGTSKDIISVGSYASRTFYTKGVSRYTYDDLNLKLDSISPYSSRGPALDGRIKPDIAAPGSIIISSLNSYITIDNNIKIDDAIRVGERTYDFGVMNGTSMAAPAVTGICALCLQANPSWNIDSLRKYIQKSANVDSYVSAFGLESEPVPNNYFGYGKIDAANLLKIAGNTLEKQEEGEPEPEFPNDTNVNPGDTIVFVEDLIERETLKILNVYPNPSSGKDEINIDLKEGYSLQAISLYDARGRRVYSNKLNKNKFSVRALEKGLYILECEIAKDGAAGGAAARIFEYKKMLVN